jgi:hypothetical protein
MMEALYFSCRGCIGWAFRKIVLHKQSDALSAGLITISCASCVSPPCLLQFDFEIRSSKLVYLCEEGIDYVGQGG